MQLALRIGAVIALASCSGTSAPVSKATTAPQAAHVAPNLAPPARLGTASEPLAYRVRLVLDSTQTTFLGEVAIDINIEEPLHTLWLHGKNLQVASAELMQGSDRHPLSVLGQPADSELLGLHSRTNLRAGRAQLRIRWRARLGDVQGLFRQTQDEIGYIYSDFEATDARIALPCYDDPRFKTPWTVAIEIPASHRAFSNEKETKRTRLANGNDLVEFAPTPPLPSYLLAVAAGPFESISGIASKTPLRIIAPKGLAENGRFVLENTGAILAYLEEYLGMAMPFRKLDFIAVPQFSGAMENPGLMTFSAGILLTGAAPGEEKKRLALGVVAHELAHLWFGDWITPDYWNDLWLNEGFATWLSEKALAHVQPAQAKDILDIAAKSAAFPIDHSLGGRRVREPINEKADIRAAFDPITYRKGGALLTMLEGWLGEERMQKSVRAYLAKGAGGTVTAELAIASISGSSEEAGVAPFFHTFLNQTGIPQLEMSLDCAATPKLHITQRRYLPLETQATAPSDVARLWHLPLCVRYPAGHRMVRQCTVLRERSGSIALKTSSCPAWVVPNDESTGYFHSLLSRKAFSDIPLEILSPREVFDYATSVTSALHAGQLGVGEAFELLEPLTQTPSSHLQKHLVRELYAVSRSLISESERLAFTAMVRRWYEPLLRAIGIAPRPSEAAWASDVRPVLLLVLAELGESKPLAQSIRREVEAWLRSPVPIDTALLSVWLHVAALGGDSTLAERYEDVASASSNRLHKALLRSLAYAFPDPHYLKRLLNVRPPPPMVWRVLANAMRTPALRAVIIETVSKKTKLEHKQELFSFICDDKALELARSIALDADEARALSAPLHACMSLAAAQRASAARYFAAP